MTSPAFRKPENRLAAWDAETSSYKTSSGGRMRSKPHTVESLPEKPRSSAKTSHANRPDDNAAPPYSLTVGQKVSHLRFGEGEVVAVDGSGSNLSATIRFANTGEKRLLLKYAKLQIL